MFYIDPEYLSIRGLDGFDPTLADSRDSELEYSFFISSNVQRDPNLLYKFCSEATSYSLNCLLKDFSKLKHPYDDNPVSDWMKPINNRLKADIEFGHNIAAYLSMRIEEFSKNNPSDDVNDIGIIHNDIMERIINGGRLGDVVKPSQFTPNVLGTSNNDGISNFLIYEYNNFNKMHQYIIMSELEAEDLIHDETNTRFDCTSENMRSFTETKTHKKRKGFKK